MKTKSFLADGQRHMCVYFWPQDEQYCIRVYDNGNISWPGVRSDNPEFIQALAQGLKFALQLVKTTDTRS